MKYFLFLHKGGGEGGRGEGGGGRGEGRGEGGRGNDLYTIW